MVKVSLLTMSEFLLRCAASENVWCVLSSCGTKGEGLVTGLKACDLATFLKQNRPG